jgi:hypothetical protein
MSCGIATAAYRQWGRRYADLDGLAVTADFRKAMDALAALVQRNRRLSLTSRIGGEDEDGGPEEISYAGVVLLLR